MPEMQHASHNTVSRPHLYADSRADQIGNSYLDTKFQVQKERKKPPSSVDHACRTTYCLGEIR